MTDPSLQLDWFLNSAAYRSVPKELRMAGGTGIALVRVDQPPGTFRRPGSDEFCLNLLFTEGSAASVDHGVRFSCRSEAGGFAMAPCDVDLGYEMEAELSFLAAIVPREMAREAIEARSGRRWDGDFGALHAGVFHNDAARALLLQLWSEADAGSPWGPLFAESATQTLILALAAAAGLPFGDPERGGVLAPWQARRVCDYVESHLAEDIALADLARLIDRSPYHFARAFKASTGFPPHRYQMRLRAERAKDLLSTTTQSVTDIANACGFASSQHMATVFRRLVGTTPSGYRRERRR